MKKTLLFVLVLLGIAKVANGQVVEDWVAEHACTKYSDRVGRSAAAKALDEHAVRLAVVAHVRHAKTRYDSLLMKGWGRAEARQHVEDTVRSVLAKWEGEGVF